VIGLTFTILGHNLQEIKRYVVKATALTKMFKCLNHYLKTLFIFKCKSFSENKIITFPGSFVKNGSDDKV